MTNKIYALYRVGQGSQTGTSSFIQMSNVDLDTLRNAANAFYSDPDEFVGRKHCEQLVIQPGEMKSNVITSDGGGQTFYRHIEIRELPTTNTPRR